VDSEQIATKYLRYFETKQETDFWAIDEVDTLVLRDPERGWEITRTLVNRALTEEALAYVAAGPLEDLLNHHGAAVMVQIEQDVSPMTVSDLRLVVSGLMVKALFGNAGMRSCGSMGLPKVGGSRFKNHVDATNKLCRAHTPLSTRSALNLHG